MIKKKVWRGLCPKACEILVLPLGIKPGPIAVEALNPNHQTTRDFPSSCDFKRASFLKQQDHFLK